MNNQPTQTAAGAGPAQVGLSIALAALLQQTLRQCAVLSSPDAEPTGADMYIIAQSMMRALRALGVEPKASLP